MLKNSTKDMQKMKVLKSSNELEFQNGKTSNEGFPKSPADLFDSVPKGPKMKEIFAQVPYIEQGITEAERRQENTVQSCFS